MEDKMAKGKRSLRAGEGSVVIGGNVSGSNIVVGNNNVVHSNSVTNTPTFVAIYKLVDEHPALSPIEKTDVKAELQEVEKEAQKGEQADESTLARHLRNVQRMAPDILDVVLATLANPLAGFGMVAKKVAQKMAQQAKGTP
jgi:hypothetical protein